MTQTAEDPRAAITCSKSGRQRWTCPPELKEDVRRFIEQSRSQETSLKQIAKRKVSKRKVSKRKVSSDFKRTPKSSLNHLNQSELKASFHGAAYTYPFPKPKLSV